MLGLCQPPLRDAGLKATLAQCYLVSQKSLILICIHFRGWSRANSSRNKLASPPTLMPVPQRHQCAAHYITRIWTNLYPGKQYNPLLIATEKYSKVIICAQRVCELIHYAVKNPRVSYRRPL